MNAPSVPDRGPDRLRASRARIANTGAEVQTTNVTNARHDWEIKCKGCGHGRLRARIRVLRGPVGHPRPVRLPACSSPGLRIADPSRQGLRRLPAFHVGVSSASASVRVRVGASAGIAFRRMRPGLPCPRNLKFLSESPALSASQRADSPSRPQLRSFGCEQVSFRALPSGSEGKKVSKTRGTEKGRRPSDSAAAPWATRTAPRTWARTLGWLDSEAGAGPALSRSGRPCRTALRVYPSRPVCRPKSVRPSELP